MILRKTNEWELWQGIHPAEIGCVREGRELCSCKYHLVDGARTLIYPFDDWREAEDKFCLLTGENSWTIFNHK